MLDAYIYDGTRTPIGRYGGKLAPVRPDDMLGSVLRGILASAPGVVVVGEAADGDEAIARAQELRPDVTIDHLRCICSLYDLVVQQGSLDKAWDAIVERVAREQPRDQFSLIEIAVEERGRRASPQWQDDACSRRLGILRGVPHTVGDRQRANINFYMLRDVRVAEAAELTSGDMSDEFARVSQALVTGQTLLA